MELSPCVEDEPEPRAPGSNPSSCGWCGDVRIIGVSYNFLEFFLEHPDGSRYPRQEIFLCSMIPHERVQHKRVRRLFGIFWSVSYTAYKHKPQSCYGAFFRNGLAASHRSLSTHVRLGANHRKNPRSELQSTPIWRKCFRGPSDALWRTAGPRQVSTGRSLPKTLPGTGMLARSTRHLGGFLPLLLSFPEVLWSL